MSEESKVELLPCPFCGSEDVHQCETGVYWIRCDGCDAEGPTADSEEGMVRAWNTRPNPRIDRAIEVVGRRLKEALALLERLCPHQDTEFWHQQDSVCEALEATLEELRALSPKPPADDTGLVEALRQLLVTAKLLYANAEGCAVNHYGNDHELHGLPGWLADSLNSIAEAENALTAHQENPKP